MLRAEGAINRKRMHRLIGKMGIARSGPVPAREQSAPSPQGPKSNYLGLRATLRVRVCCSRTRSQSAGRSAGTIRKLPLSSTILQPCFKLRAIFLQPVRFSSVYWRHGN